MLNTTSKPFWELLDLSENNPEHELFESLINEKTDISGFPILYYVKLNEPEATTDTIFGENPISEFSKGYKTKIIYDVSDESQVLDMFGISSGDTIQYMQIPKGIFKRDVESSYLEDYPEDEKLKPKVGDCIRTLWNNKLYELVEKGSESKIFQAKKLIWEFIVKPYRYSEESDSAESMVFDEIDEDDFPEINITTTSEKLSGYGDNQVIEEKSNDIVDYDSDNGFFGYDNL